MKCLAMSLTLVKSRVNSLSIESCDSTGGMVGVVIGWVVSIGVTTGRDGVADAPVDGIVVGMVGDECSSVDGVVWVIVGIVIHVDTIVPVFTVGTSGIGRVVLLL